VAAPANEFHRRFSVARSDGRCIGAGCLDTPRGRLAGSPRPGALRNTHRPNASGNDRSPRRQRAFEMNAEHQLLSSRFRLCRSMIGATARIVNYKIARKEIGLGATPGTSRRLPQHARSPSARRHARCLAGISGRPFPSRICGFPGVGKWDAGRTGLASGVRHGRRPLDSSGVPGP
jgi:hypothetical protein